MREVAAIFDKNGNLISWHMPEGRDTAYIPDTKSLADVLYAQAEEIGGVAHTHPWDGPARPSHEDVTSWSSIELGLSVRWIWPIITMTDVGFFRWCGPGKYHYERLPIINDWLITAMRKLSQKED